MFKISKAGVEYTYNSINAACKANGATGSGMNRQACEKFLFKAGFDMNSIVEDAKATITRTGVKSASIIEKLIVMAQTVDTALIKKLTEEVNTRVKNLSATSTAGDLQPIVDLNKQIAEAQNPVVTLESILKLVTNLYNDEMKKRGEEAKNTKTV